MENLYMGNGSTISDTCPGNQNNVFFGLSVYDSICMRFTAVGNWSNCSILHLASLDTLLVFGFTSSVPQYGNYYASFDGNNILPLGDGFNFNVGNSIVFRNKLIVSGGFTSNYSGTLPLNNIAEWNGSTWQPFNATCDLNYGPALLNIFNSLLIATGTFDSCGINPVFQAVSYPGAFAVGLEEKSNNIGLSLYPNPCTGHLNIAFDQHNPVLSVNCRNLLGQIQKMDFIQNEEGIQISTSALSSGIYLLEVTTNEGIGYSKFYKADSN
jgi:hypothetical protein